MMLPSRLFYGNQTTVTQPFWLSHCSATGMALWYAGFGILSYDYGVHVLILDN